MTRKEMIEVVAKKAKCSKRLVRRKLFKRLAEVRRWRYPEARTFCAVMLDKSINWVDFEEAYAQWKTDKFHEPNPYMMSNTFEVYGLPSGVIVHFRLDGVYDGEIYPGYADFGCRLYNHKGVYG